MARPDRREARAMVGEALLWLLFVSLLVPVGLTGWAIGHYTAGGKHTVTRTVTVTPATTQPPAAATTAATATTAAAATTAPATTAPATTAPATTAAATGNPARGKSVFISSGCGACHTFGPAASSATIGPDLDTKPALDAKKEHMQLAAFIRESIVSPNAYISSGYTSGVMPQTFRSTLSKIQLADLVAFITAGGK